MYGVKVNITFYLKLIIREGSHVGAFSFLFTLGVVKDDVSSQETVSPIIFLEGRFPRPIGSYIYPPKSKCVNCDMWTGCQIVKCSLLDEK